MKKNDEITRRILIKVPVKFFWTFAIFMMVSGTTINWWSEWLSDVVFRIAFSIFMGLSIYWFRLCYVFYSRKSLKQLVIDADDHVVLIYQMLRSRNPVSYEYRTIKQSIKIVVKGRKMNLLKNGESIARIYKNTLKNKNDWDWLISYFD